MRFLTYILILPVLIVGSIFLQVFLSNRISKWFGLLLPAISFITSILLVSSIVSYTNIGIVSSTHSEDGTIISTVIEDTRTDFGGVVEQVVITFLLANIPTVVFITIYAACRKKYNQKLEIEKMQIQDLE